MTTVLPWDLDRDHTLAAVGEDIRSDLLAFEREQLGLGVPQPRAWHSALRQWRTYITLADSGPCSGDYRAAAGAELAL